LQSKHLQSGEQRIFAWKHSQYFLRHTDFLQWQPLWCFESEGAPASWWQLKLVKCTKNNHVKIESSKLNYELDNSIKEKEKKSTTKLWSIL
jgi:hypothetical protein